MSPSAEARKGQQPSDPAPPNSSNSNLQPLTTSNSHSTPDSDPSSRSSSVNKRSASATPDALKASPLPRSSSLAATSANSVSHLSASDGVSSASQKGLKGSDVSSQKQMSSTESLAKKGPRGITQPEGSEEGRTEPVYGLSRPFFSKIMEQSALLGLLITTHISASWLGFGLPVTFLIFLVGAMYVNRHRNAYKRNVAAELKEKFSIPRQDPGFEETEWVNGILSRFWVQYEPILSDTIVASIDPILEASCPSFLESIKFTKFTLGSKAPRLEGIKYFHKTDKDKAVFVMDLSFIPASEKSGSGMRGSTICLGIRVGKSVATVELPILVQDIAFSGSMEFKIKMMSAFPCIKLVEMAFTEEPKIDFVLKPVGGSMGVDVMKLGLSDFITNLIGCSLKASMVKPVYLPIDVDAIMNGAGAEADSAKGVLRVKVFECIGLKKMDLVGSTDPYVKISLNGVEVSRTRSLENTTSPFFDELHYILLTHLASPKLLFEVFDWNGVRKDQIVGSYEYEIPELETLSETVESQESITHEGKSGRGEIRFDVTWYPVLQAAPVVAEVPAGGEGKADSPETVAVPVASPATEKPKSNVGILRINVHQASQLDSKSQISGFFDSFVKVIAMDKEVLVTKVKKRNNDPVWEEWIEVFVSSLRKFRGSVALHNQQLGTDPKIGEIPLNASRIQGQIADPLNDWFKLGGAKKGKVRLTFQWKPISEEIMGCLRPIAVVRAHVVEAEKLANVEVGIGGLTDPYVVLKSRGKVRGRTQIIENTLNPSFDQVFYVVIGAPKERLNYEVFDYNKTRSDKLIGIAETQVPSGDELEHKKLVLKAGKKTSCGHLIVSQSMHPVVARTSTMSSDMDETPRGSMELKREPTNVNALEIPEIDLQTALQAHKSGIVTFYINEVKNLPKRSDYFLEVYTDEIATPQHRSKTIKKSVMGFFDDHFDIFVKDIQHTGVTVVLCESKGADSAKELCEWVGQLSQTLTNPAEWHPMRPVQPVGSDLSSSDEEQLKCSEGERCAFKMEMSLSPVAMQLNPRELRTNTGFLHLDILDASELPSVDFIGTCDPYVSVVVNQEKLFKTQAHKKNKNPKFDETFLVPLQDRISSNLVLEVRDYNKVGGSKLLGEGRIDLKTLSEEDFQDPDEPGSGKSTEVTLNLVNGQGKLRVRYMFAIKRLQRNRRVEGVGLVGQGVGAIGGVVGSGIGAVGAGVGVVGSGLGAGVGLVGKGVATGAGALGKVGGGVFSVVGKPAGNALKGMSKIGKKEKHEDGAAFSPSPSHEDLDFASLSHSPSWTSLGAGEAGSISITICAARNIAGADSGGTSDPYVKVVMNGPNMRERQVHKTKVVRKNCSPEWNETAKTTLPKLQQGDVNLTFHLKDFNRFGGNTDLGDARVEVWSLMKEASAQAVAGQDGMALLQIDRWLPLSPTGESQAKKVDVGGEIHVQLELRVPAHYVTSSTSP